MGGVWGNSGRLTCFLFVCVSSVTFSSVAGITSCNRLVLEELKLANPSYSAFSTSALDLALSKVKGSESVGRKGLPTNPPPTTECGTEPEAISVCCGWPILKPVIPFETTDDLGIAHGSIPKLNDPPVFNGFCCGWPNEDPGSAAILEEPCITGPGRRSEPNNVPVAGVAEGSKDVTDLRKKG